jgi:hypothetical protein
MKNTTTIKRKIKIQKSKDEVWKAIADFGNICHGHPNVKTSFVTSDKKHGIGATRHCDFTMMKATAEERAIEWNDGQNIKIEIYELKNMPGIDKAYLDLRLNFVSENETELSGIFEYSMKNKLFETLNSLAMKRSNGKLINGIMAGHKKYIETGVIVNDKTPLDLSQVEEIA